MPNKNKNLESVPIEVLHRIFMFRNMGCYDLTKFFNKEDIDTLGSVGLYLAFDASDNAIKLVEFWCKQGLVIKEEIRKCPESFQWR